MAEEMTFGKAIGDGLDAYAQYSDPRYAQMRANARREKNEDEDRAFQREQRARQRKGWNDDDAKNRVAGVVVDGWMNDFGGGQGSAGTPTTPPSPGQPSAPPPPDMGTPGVSQTMPVQGIPSPPADDSLAAAAPAGAMPATGQPPTAGAPAGGAPQGAQGFGRPNSQRAATIAKRVIDALPPEQRHLAAPYVASAMAAEDEAFPQALVMLARGDMAGAQRVFNSSGQMKVEKVEPGSKPGTYKVTMNGQTAEVDPRSELMALAKQPLDELRKDDDSKRRGAESEARIGLYGAQAGAAHARARSADAAAGASNARAAATRAKANAPQPELPALKGPDVDRVHKEVEQAFANMGLAGRDAFGNVTYKNPADSQVADRAKSVARRAFQQGQPISGEAAVAIAKEGKPSRGVRIAPDGSLVSSEGIKHQGRVYSVDGAPEQRATQDDLVTLILDIGIDKIDHPRFRQEIIPAAKKAGIFSAQESDEDIAKLVKEWVRARRPDPGDPLDQRASGAAAPPPRMSQSTPIASGALPDRNVYATSDALDPNAELQTEPDTEVPDPEDEEDTLDAAGRGPLQFGPRLTFPPPSRPIY